MDLRLPRSVQRSRTGPKLPCKLSKLALPKKNFIVRVSRRSFCFFVVVFSLYFSCISLSAPRPTFPAPPFQSYPSHGPRLPGLGARARTQYFGNIRDERTEVPNTTPERRCDGMFEFRYAAFQCENFSLSHSAAFAGAAATAENGTAGRPIEVPSTHYPSYWPAKTHPTCSVRSIRREIRNDVVDHR